MENERNDAYKEQKVSEERLKLVQEEQSRTQGKLKMKNDARVSELEMETSDLQMKLKELEQTHRSHEEDDFKKNTEYNKLNALIE